MHISTRRSLLALTVLGSLTSLALAPQAKATSIEADLNGDGYEDLVIGASTEDVGAIQDAGAVHVMFGSAGGLVTANNQLWTQDSVMNNIAIQGTAEAKDYFGAAIAHGDFDGDGYTDLVIASPLESAGATEQVGQINVLYGGPSGPSADGNQVFYHDTVNIQGVAQAYARFGSSLAAGDFNGDGKDDIAIGSPSYDVNGFNSAGAINVIFGSASGLTTSYNQFFTQDTTNVQEDANIEDYFGSTLAAGDFDGDGVDDLAVGAPGESVEGYYNPGAVHVFYGYPMGRGFGGLTTTGNQLWTQNSPDVPDQVESDEKFGSALAAGDFDGDGIEDLAIGALEKIGTFNQAGAVTVLYGGGAGLTGIGSQQWTQDSASVPGVAEAGDLFGRTLRAGRFNGDAIDDLAIGAPGESIGSEIYGGAVNVIFGSAAGLTGNGSQVWYQGGNGLPDAPANHDWFGDSIGRGDLNGDGIDELVIGANGQYVNGQGLAGVVHILYGQAAGPGSAGNQLLSQDTVGVLDQAEAADYFGGAFNQ